MLLGTFQNTDRDSQENHLYPYLAILVPSGSSSDPITIKGRLLDFSCPNRPNTYIPEMTAD